MTALAFADRPWDSQPSFAHRPVMVKAVMEALAVRPGGLYIDGTVGEGGHAEAILRAAAGVRLLGIDLDPQALARARERLAPFAGAGASVVLIEGNYREIAQICRERGLGPANGILLDLGLSSFQLAREGRGFSFQRDDPLDMRYSPHQGITAADIVNTYSEEELAEIIWRYGEERRSRRIARLIVANRPITTTRELASIVEQAVGRAKGRTPPATRTFQALRLAVNQELANLEAALPQAHGLLDLRARLVVLTYHSLEDRIVKEFIRRESRDCLCPPSMPVCRCGHRATLRPLFRRTLAPSPEEVAENPRSHSARLRAAERAAWDGEPGGQGRQVKHVD